LVFRKFKPEHLRAVIACKTKDYTL